MATFAAKTFNAATYAAFRPAYPSSLYATILNYHRGPRKLCLDLGCGHGLIAQSLAGSFTSVLATDPSQNMIATAREAGGQAGLKNIEYKVASAESLPFLGDGSVDLVVAGQAAHWFDYEKVWPELRRVVRRGGTMAFWGYKDPVFVGHPTATHILDEYSYGEDKDLALGPYWEEPGRSIVRNLFRDIKPPPEMWADEVRMEYVPVPEKRSGGEGTCFVEKSMSVAQAAAYMRTFSSFHGWAEAHPEQKPRNDGGKGDLVDRAFDDIKEAEGWDDEGETVHLEWGSALIMARSRE